MEERREVGRVRVRVRVREREGMREGGSKRKGG